MSARPLRRLGVGLVIVLASGAGLALDGYRIVLQITGFAAGKYGWVELALSLVLLSAASLLAGVLALILLWRARRRPEAWSLALFLSLVSFMLGSDAFWSLAARYHMSATARNAVDVLTSLAGIMSIAAVLRFSALFPAALQPQDVRGRGAAGRLRGALLDSRLVWTASLGVFALLLLGGTVDSTWLARPVALAVALGGLLASVANLRTGYGHADPDGRRRVFWLLEGFAAGGAVLLIASALKLLQMVGALRLAFGSWYGLAIYLSFLLILLGVAVSVFYSGALDPALAVRRTAVLGLVGVVMVFVFAAVENTVQGLVATRLGMSPHVSGLLSGGIVALAFDPVKDRAGRLVGRWAGETQPQAMSGKPALAETATTSLP